MTIGKLGKDREETTNEQVITDAGTTIFVEDELTTEQKYRELVSCGRLRRDAPGADEEEVSIIDELLRKAKDGERAEAQNHSRDSEGSVFISGDSDKKPAESKSRKQKASIRQSLYSFCDEFAGRIRVALVKAMESEEQKNAQNSFTNLSDWDFTAPCAKEGCNGNVRSNILIRKQRGTGRCHCGTVQEKLHLYDKFEDNSNVFHRISEQVAESILKEVCTTRYKGSSGFSVTLGGKTLELELADGDKRSKLSGNTSKQRFTSNSAQNVGRVIECIIAVNDYREKLDLAIPEIGISTDSGLTALDLCQLEADDGSEGVFYALASRVRDEIASRLKPFRIDDPSLAHLENGVDSWAEEISSHILYAIDAHDGLISIESASFSNGRKNPLASPDQNNSILKLSQDATEFVDRLIEEGDGLLTEFLSKETVPPMICEPLDWVLDEERLAVGGYLTPWMRNEMPIVPREAAHIRMGMNRISITQDAIDSINIAQKTEFRVSRTMLDLQLEALRELIADYSERCIEARQSGEVLLVSIKEGTEDLLNRLPDPHSLEMWMRQAMCASNLLESDLIDGRFYHPLRMDHRGRMYTSSSWLDPQGDDFSRGLIRLGARRALDEEGWKWLRISVAKIWEGLGEELPKKHSSFEELLHHTKSPESPFVKMLVEVADDPIRTIDLWSDGRKDIVRAHSEGFVRLSATLAFVDALNHGGVGATTDYVVVQDASSNIYQHMSLLLRDKDMAMLVNVLESERPEDIYEKVADAIKDTGSGAGRKAIEALSKVDGISSQAGAKILSGIATRKNSKSPVMTKGYGSGKDALVDMLISHNGKPGRKKNGRRKGSAGKFGWENTRSGEEEEYTQEFESAAREAGEKIVEISQSIDQILATVKVNSTAKNPELGIFDDLPKWRDTVRKIVLSALGSEGMGRTKLLEEWGARFDDDSYQALVRLYDSTKSPWKRCAHQNSTLLGVISKVESGIDPKDHEEIAEILASAFEDAIKEVIPNYNLKSKGGFKDLMKSESPLTWSTGDNGVEIRHISLIPPRSEPIKRRKAEQNGGNEQASVGMVSKRVHSSERDEKAEERAIAPNFVHSLDAEHMRFVIRRICSQQQENGLSPEIWMVHDAFGCHPNDMGALREAAAEGLLEVHGKRGSTDDKYENILDEMHGGNFFNDRRKAKGIGTLEMGELEGLNLNNWYFLN